MEGFCAAKRESRKHGQLRGLGVGQFGNDWPPSKRIADVPFNADGTVTLMTGTLELGQGQSSPFAQVLSEKLGIPFDRISLVQGDSERLSIGGGFGGSQSLMDCGTAMVQASAKVIERGREVAA